MGEDLESPPGPSGGWPADLYRARGTEVVPSRPVFTGDIYAGVEVQTPGRGTKARTVMVLQHPCALRTNGVDLVPGVLVASVRPHRALSQEEWVSHGRLMPLPDLLPDATGASRDQAGFFETIYIAAREQLVDRVACLSQLGVNLLLQRWVRHNSRVVVPTHVLNEQVSAAYEESELIEEWCLCAAEAGTEVSLASAACLAWLREDLGGSTTRQQMLEDPQKRGRVRRDLRVKLASIYE